MISPPTSRQLLNKRSWQRLNKRVLSAFWVGIAVGVALLLVTVPAVTATFAAAVVCAQLGLLSVCNVHFLKRGASSPAALRNPSVLAPHPFLSVHLPAHNEPPHILIATLASLHHQINAPDYEVIIVVNNTSDPALWQPVQAWCADAGRLFRFLRADGVTGAKAGALNIALQAANPQATHVVIIDADYHVVPDFLKLVSDQIAATGADFIQFPQAYRHLTPATEGLSVELADYFNRHARAANLAQAMLLTGTLSVIRISALSAVGGWPSRSGTEDAALGSRLIAAGYAGVFIDRIVGRGLMPLDLPGLHHQRHRWAAGNALVLLDTVRGWRDAAAPSSTWMHKALVAAQLAAWLNLGAGASVALVAAVLQLAFGLAAQDDFAPLATISLSLATFVLILSGAIHPLLWQTGSQPHGAIQWQALLSRVAMLPVAACATVSGAFARQQKFRVTPKHTSARPRASPWSALNITGAGAIAVIFAGAAMQYPLAVVSGLVLLLPLVCAIAPRRALFSYSATVASQES